MLGLDLEGPWLAGCGSTRCVMCDADRLIKLVFSGLSPLVIEGVSDEDGLVRVRARTPEAAVACPGCGVHTSRVHSYAERTVADVALDARRVLLGVRVRRLVCPTRGCRQTFREQLPGVLERYQRRTPRLAADRRDRAGVSRPRQCAGAVHVDGVPVGADRVALPAAPAASAGHGAAGVGRGRFRAAPQAPLRHDPHRRADPPPCGRPARPRRRRVGDLATRPSRCGGGLPGRFRYLRRSGPPCPA
ncbi:hypothetical protein FrEUN1fDRAFT_5552 [Parafrankia sp. EUN1f]|nr:hypothetical protein FrEUN1fDRAFT_5552 [Parafrankia sp. EUN1f]